MYYADIGQRVPVSDSNGMWEFDWLLTTRPVVGEVEVRSAVRETVGLARLPEWELQFVSAVPIWEQEICPLEQGRWMPEGRLRLESHVYLYRVVGAAARVTESEPAEVSAGP